jgi:hypothetical protein
MKAIDDYINGNLTDAKKAARGLSWRGLYSTLRVRYNKSIPAAMAIADYLKGRGTFQAACDADRKAAR